MKPEDLALFDKIPAIISIDDKEHVITWMNTFALSILGVPREQIVGTHMKDLFPGKADKYIAENETIFRTGKPLFDLLDSLEIHGETRWYKSTKIPFSDEKGEITEIVVFLTDVTNHIRDIQARVDSEFKYRNLFDMSPLSILVLDLHGVIIDCNQKTLELVESNVEDLINKPIIELDFLRSEDKTLIMQKFEEITNILNTPVYVTKLHFPKKKFTKTVEVHPYILEKEGQPYAVQIIVLDITKEKEHELELQQNEIILKKERDFALKLSTVETIEEMAHVLVETALDLSSMDSGGLILYDKVTNSFHMQDYRNFPDSMKGMLGAYSTDNRLHQAFFSTEVHYLDYNALQHIRDTDMQKEKFKSVLSYPIIVRNEVFGRLNLASHSLEVIPKTAQAFLDLIVKQIAGVISKIQSQDEVKFNEQKLQVLFDLGQMSEQPVQNICDFALKEAVRLTKSQYGTIAFIIDERQIEFISWGNEGETQVFKKTSQNRINFKDFGLLGLSFEQRKLIIQNNVKAGIDAETSNQYVDEKIRRFLSVPVFHENAIVSVASVSNKKEDYNESDVRLLTLIAENLWTILEKKQAKEKRESENIKIQKLESLGLLAGGIAHDFNNILTAILGNISLIELSVDDSTEIIARIDDAKIALLQAKDLTHQLLTFSKGGAPIKKLDTISDLLVDSTQFMLRGSNVKPEFQIQKEIWSVEIDKAQISQVINNLVLNAMQAMPGGGILRVSAENFSLKESDLISKPVPLEPGSYILIKIQDEGIGIPERYLTKIFDPYFTTKEKGSGLGLATSYSILKKHGGYITVESEVGIGSTFLIYLPACPEKSIKPQLKSEGISRGAGRILVMDDDPSVRKVASILLKKIGYEVQTAENGEQAIEMYINNMKSNMKTDLLIMDLTVPAGMGGKEALSEILKIDPNAIAIVSSGYYTDGVMAEYEKYGFKGVIAKPYKLEDLSKIIKTLLDKN